MSRLLILGAGGLGRIIFDWIPDIDPEGVKWDRAGFLDDNPHALDSYGLSEKIVGSIKDYVPQAEDELICAIGDTAARSRICEDMIKRAGNFINIIHPDAQVSNGCELGKGLIIFPGAYIFTNTIVGDFSVINTLTAVGHDAVVEQGCVISAQCDIMGFVHLGREVFLGSGARILPGVRIGERSRVGAGSVVLRNVKEGCTVFGNPAKMIHNPQE